MNIVDLIRKPVLRDLDLFDQTFEIAMKTDNPLLSGVHDYILQQSGKKLRPTLVMLAARLVGEANMASVYGALAIELLHTASLVHDDVVDDTHIRRGKESVNAHWTNKIAILSGDYMLSNSLLQVANAGKISILKALSHIGMQLSDGELLQLVSTQSNSTREEDYLKIIQHKTAFLFAACTEVGALSVDADPAAVQHIRKYGEYLGFCFQIKDDIFDYHSDIEIGKPTGNDLRDGKITLPLLYALNNADETTRKSYMKIISDEDFSDENLALLTEFARKSGGLEYAEMRMEEFRSKAIEELNDFPDSEIKQSLLACVDFAITRTK